MGDGQLANKTMSTTARSSHWNTAIDVTSVERLERPKEDGSDYCKSKTGRVLMLGIFV